MSAGEGERVSGGSSPGGRLLEVRMGRDKRQTSDRFGDQVKVATFFYRHEAELARSVLSANGIQSIIKADDTGGPVPGLEYVRGVHLYVHIGDAALARQILEVDEAESE